MRKPSIDERLEALTHTMELFQSGLRDMKGFADQIAEGTARLLHIAQIHEHRITKLEGGD